MQGMRLACSNAATTAHGEWKWHTLPGGRRHYSRLAAVTLPVFVAGDDSRRVEDMHKPTSLARPDVAFMPIYGAACVALLSAA